MIDKFFYWLEHFLRANAALMALTGMGFYGFFKYKFEKMKGDKASVDTRLSNLEHANLAMLHNKIYVQCAKHLEEGFISIADLDDLDYLFNAYKNLGGNGTGEILYNKVKALPNKKTKEGN
ncbi:hypothetical protein [Vagococcus fluvialis]|uniref:hypothetical protein n=1 Tax=Vagococcus fluvialis TaxID=2738 RepID=UPI003B59D58D